MNDPNVPYFAGSTPAPERDADLALVAKTLAAGDDEAFALATRAMGDTLALLQVYEERGLIGAIDWRSEPEETIEQVDPMLRRLGTCGFDWSFVDVLVERGDGTEMRNNNFLSLLRDRLRAQGLALVHIDQFWDSYGFAVLTIEAFAKINGMRTNVFRICDDFGADESYERGKAILAEAAAQD
jgi:hypothetical protein